MNETNVKIFISYSHAEADKKICKTIAESLEQVEGLSIWYDKELIAGEEYRKRIVEKIETADVFIVLLSGNSIQSKWVKKEVEYAEGKLDRLVPIWIEDIKLPGDWLMILQGYHGLFWYSRESDSRFIDSLAASLLQKNDTNDGTSFQGGGRITPDSEGVPLEKLMLDDTFAHSKELTAALEDFKQRKFDLAFQAFSQLAEKKDAKAQLMLARMYAHGLGIEKSESRAEFWLDSAAKLGDPEAQYAYGKMLVDAAGQEKKTGKSQWEKGMAQLKAAADHNYRAAMKKYIEESYRGFSSFVQRIWALNYCDQVVASSNDVYEKSKFEEIKGELGKRQLKDIGKTVDKAISTAVCTIGVLVSFVGALYLMVGLLPALLETNPLLGKLPAVTEEVLIPVKIYWNWVFTFSNVFGAFGLELILIGTLICGVFKERPTWKMASIAANASFPAYLVVICWYLGAYAKLGGDFNTGDQNQMAFALLAILVSVVLGWIIGAICSNILSAVFPAQIQNETQAAKEIK